MGTHVRRTPIFLSEALLAHDVHVSLERPRGTLPQQFSYKMSFITNPPPALFARDADHTGGESMYQHMRKRPVNETPFQCLLVV